MAMPWMCRRVAAVIFFVFSPLLWLPETLPVARSSRRQGEKAAGMTAVSALRIVNEMLARKNLSGAESGLTARNK